MITLGDGGCHSNCDRFLSDVQMQKAANLSLLVKLGALFFEAPNGDHAPIPTEEILLTFHIWLELL